MGVQGQLTKATFGYSVPVDAPLYTPFPVLYEDVTMLVFPYVTSADAAARHLPAQFELSPVPVFAIGGMTPERAGECRARGAHGIAVMSDLFQSSDLRARLREYESALGTL